MSPRIKAFGLLMVVFVYLIDGTNFNSSISPFIFSSEQSVLKLSTLCDTSVSFFLQPVTTMPAPILVGFMYAANQTTSQYRVWQSEISYTFHNDLSKNHPISVYKISLNAHTADG